TGFYQSGGPPVSIRVTPPVSIRGPSPDITPGAFPRGGTSEVPPRWPTNMDSAPAVCQACKHYILCLRFRALARYCLFRFDDRSARAEAMAEVGRRRLSFDGLPWCTGRVSGRTFSFPRECGKNGVVS